MPLQNPEIIWWGSFITTAVMAWVCSHNVGRAVVGIALYKKIPVVEALNTLLRSVKRHGIVGLILWTAAPLLLLCVSKLGDIAIPPISYIPLFLYQFYMLSWYSLPPSVLLLATSRWNSVRLYYFLARGVWPYRVIVLFEPQLSERERHSGLAWDKFNEDNFRLRNHKDWQVTVRQIANTVPIIVLDSRVASPGVIEEAKLLLSGPLSDKTLILINEDGTAPAIDAVKSVEPPIQLKTTLYKDVLSSVKQMGLKWTFSPDTAPSLGFMVAKWHARRLEKGMWTVAQLGLPLENALKALERRGGWTNLAQKTRILQSQLNGNPGDGTLEVFAQLNADILCTEQLVELARSDQTTPELQELINCLQALQDALCRLQLIIDIMPDTFLIPFTEYLRQKHGGQ